MKQIKEIFKFTGLALVITAALTACNHSSNQQASVKESTKVNTLTALTSADTQKFLDDLIAAIVEFLEFFQITLPSTGVYALYLPNQSGGNDGIKSQLSGAGGIPDLGYAAGILFVATEGDVLIAGGGSKNPIDLLALVLGLL